MDDLDKLLQEISDGDAKVSAAARFVRDDKERRLRAAAGPIYDSISTNREQAISALQCEDPSVQKVAMELFVHHWSVDKGVEEICERQTLCGPIDVRLCAINTLSFTRNRLYGEKISSTLAGYALNPAIELELRRSIYSLLLVFFGTPEQKSSQYQPNEVTRTSSDIDPQVVQQCIQRDYSAKSQGGKTGPKT